MNEHSWYAFDSTVLGALGNVLWRRLFQRRKVDNSAEIRLETGLQV